MGPPAPPLLSTITAWPSAFCSSGATSRATTSLVPPVMGTTMRTVFVDDHYAARAGAEMPAAIKARSRNERRWNAMDIDVSLNGLRMSDRVDGLVLAIDKMNLGPLLRLLVAGQQDASGTSALMVCVDRRWLGVGLQGGGRFVQHPSRHHDRAVGR